MRACFSYQDKLSLGPDLSSVFSFVFFCLEFYHYVDSLSIFDDHEVTQGKWKASH